MAAESVHPAMYHAARRRPVLLRPSVERQPAGRDREIYRRGPDGCEQTENLNRTAVYETRWKRKADVNRPST
ncbi:hypothetical protein [Prevotella denticola]|uniref:hypothetical protein n=1 Tax=Prevotella denticola TaxID=28129 RepID=UPI00241C0B40|nr:hypothetical protein [Prevotella denticola]